jgi:two-component system sensor histidine kinase KdpD
MLKAASKGYAIAAASVVVCTAAGFAMHARFDVVNIAMVYLLGVVLVALYFPRGPAIFASTASVVAFDVLFVAPRGRITVEDAQYLLTFAIMLVVALVISRLVHRIRSQAQAHAKLEVEAETERIRSALLASISHDLRTPLAVIAGASSTLSERGERLAPEARQALATSLFDQASDLSERVSKVLQMTRLQTGAIRVDRDWSSPAEIVSSALARLESRMASHRVVVELPDDLPLLRVDASLIEQALGNLLENAAKHTPLETIVRVRVQPRDHELVFSVEDYGGGLGDDAVSRVFEKFQHGTTSTESATSGMGLGLAIARAIVRLHGGHAWAERVPAGGMAFRFSLPVEAAPPAPREAATS